jgi:hypothetical protein
VRMRLLLTLIALLAFAGFASAQTGTITTNGQCRSIDTDNKGQGTLEVSGTWTGTLTWYVSNGVSRAAVDLGTPAAPGTAVNSTTANGHWYGNVGGWRSFEVCATAAMTGTATIWLNASNAGSPLVFAAGGGGGAGTSDTTEATQLLVLAAVDGLETNTAATLTSTNFAAAFGTAGTADTQVMSIQGIASMTPILATVSDGAGALNVIIDSATLGTVTVATHAVTATDLDVQSGGADILSTTAFNAALGTAGTADTQVMTVQGIASMTPLLVTASASDLDVQSGGVDLASEATADAARDLLQQLFDSLSDPAQFDNAVATAPDLVPTACEGKDVDGSALPNAVTEGNFSRPACALNGAAYTVLLNEAGTTDIGAAMNTALASILTAVQLSDDAVFTDDAAFTPATSKGFVIGGQADDTSTDSVDEGDFGAFRISLDRLLYTRMADPCSGGATKLYLPFDITTATTTEITPSLAGASTHYYICALNIISQAANSVNLVDDNSDNCASVTASLISSGLAATDGWYLAANGGLTIGNGLGSIMRTQTANSVLCLVTSAATELHGQFVVVAAP